ncbi:MAG TPA: alpha/beta hydrolase [Solirubrobacterales bacterium]|nr:alpha/beta hydrolase [Solirubrobacterales bacterium]
MRREELVFEVADGRRLAAQLAGPEDGDLLVFHMGTPGSRDLWELYIEEGARRGLRHLCCSRPGYAGSDRQPGRSIADCAADTAAVAAQMGAERFYVVGASTGADFALACAALLPEQVISTAAVSGFAPRGRDDLDWYEGMEDLNVREFKALEEGPVALERYITECVREYGEIRTAAELIESMDGAISKADQAVLSDSFLDFQLDGCGNVARDGIWGWFDDDYALWGDWGFDPARIEVPVSIWHGGEDLFIPFSHGRWLASHIPRARPHLLPEEGHLSLWARHYGAILDELLAA